MALTTLQAAARADGIGASEVGTVLGINPRKSPYTLWLEKTGKVQPEDISDSRAVQLGNVMEPVILDFAAQELKQKVVRPTGTFKAENGVMLANLDGMVGVAKRGSEAVEAKSNWFNFDGWGEPGTAEVPPIVLAQCVGQMVCSDAPRVHVARLVGSFGLVFSLYHIERPHPDILAQVEERVCDFWHNHVEKDIPPADSLPSADAMRRIERVRASVQVSPELVAAFQEAKKLEADAKKAKEAAYAALTSAMVTEDGQFADEGTCPGFVVRFSDVPVKEYTVQARVDRRLSVKAATGV